MKFNLPNEFVSFVSYEIHNSSFISNSEQVATQFDENEFEEEESKRFGSSLSQNPRIELSLRSSDNGRKENIRRQCHH